MPPQNPGIHQRCLRTELAVEKVWWKALGHDLFAWNELFVLKIIVCLANS
jgi:hypothetical protein